MSKLRKKGKNAEESSNFHTLIHSFFNCIIFPLYISLLWRCSVQLINTCTEKRIKEFSSRTAASCDSFIFFSPPCLFPFCSRQKNSLKLHVSERRERERSFFLPYYYFLHEHCSRRVLVGEWNSWTGKSFKLRDKSPTTRCSRHRFSKRVFLSAQINNEWME